MATNLPFGDHGLFAERCYAHRSYIVACRSAAPPLDATFVSVDEPMRSILTIDVEGTSYVLAGGEGHPATASVDSAERYRRLAAFAGDTSGRRGDRLPLVHPRRHACRRAALRRPNVSGVPACPRDHRAAKMGPDQRHGRGLDPAGHAVRHPQSVGRSLRQHQKHTGNRCSTGAPGGGSARRRRCCSPFCSSGRSGPGRRCSAGRREGGGRRGGQNRRVRQPCGGRPAPSRPSARTWAAPWSSIRRT